MMSGFRISVVFAILAGSFALFLVGFTVAVVFEDPLWKARWMALQPNNSDSVEPTELHRLVSWDANHYLHIARHGYTKGDPICAFYPLWPLVLRSFAVKWNSQAVIMTSTVLANIMFIGSCFLLLKLYSQYGEKHECYSSLLLFVTYPAAFILHVPFTESLCLLLILTIFALEEEKHQGIRFAACVLVPLCRPIGVCLLLPLCWRWLVGRRRYQIYPVIGVAAGFMFYLVYMHNSVGNMFEGFIAQHHYTNSPSLMNAVMLPDFIEAFMNGALSFQSHDSLLDRIVFMGVVATLPALWKMERSWFFFVLAVGILPALTSYFVSYTRFALLLFPVFLVWTRWLGGTKPGRLYGSTVVIFAVLQLILLWRFLDSERAT